MTKAKVQQTAAPVSGKKAPAEPVCLITLNDKTKAPSWRLTVFLGANGRALHEKRYYRCDVGKGVKMATYLNCNAENGRPAARVGDSVSCPKHGTVTIIFDEHSGSPNTNYNGKPAARKGDRTSCGATIIEGSDTVRINGKPAAYVGCATDHGGKITSGSPTIFVGATNIEPENYEHDQHLIFEDQDEQLIDNIPYRLTTPQGEVIKGMTGVDGKTKIIGANAGEMLNCDFAIKEEV